MLWSLMGSFAQLVSTELPTAAQEHYDLKKKFLQHNILSLW